MTWQDTALATLDDHLEDTGLIKPRDEVVPLLDVSDLSAVFALDPVPLPVFLKDRYYLRFPPLSDEQFKAVALCETILFRETFQSLGKLKGWDYVNAPWWRWGYTVLGLMWGKGSGKDTMARVIAARIVNLLTSMKAPHLYYNFDQAASMDIINVARSSLQANNAFFSPFKRLVEASPYFADKIHNSTINELQFVANGPGASGGTVTAHSGHADQESQEGGNLIFGCADEIASFKVQSETRTRLSPRAAAMSADAIMDMLESSGQSRFPKLAKTLAISYPRFRGDYMTQLKGKAAHEEAYSVRTGNPSTIYFTKKSTYEVNPTITRAMLEDQYRKNPEKAAQLYDCEPPAAINTFYKKPHLIEKCFRKNAHLMGPIDDQGFLFPTVKFDHGKKCAAHLDLAHSETGDRAGIAICHLQDWMVSKTTDGNEMREPIIFTDVLTSFHAAELGEPELQYAMFEHFVLGCVAKGLKIRLVTADQFQSKTTLQNLQRAGIEVRHRSVDRDTSAHDLLKQTIYNDRLETFYRERCETELKELQLLNGIKVDHPQDGSKDEADALAGAVAGVYEIAFDEIKNSLDSAQTGWADRAVSPWQSGEERVVSPWDRQTQYSTFGTPRTSR